MRLGIFATSFCVYVFIIEKGMKTCKAGHFGNKPFSFKLVLLYRVFKYVRLDILATILCVYVSVVEEGKNYDLDLVQFLDFHLVLMMVPN